MSDQQALLNNQFRLPDGWSEISIGELAEQVTKGTTPTTYGYKYVDNGIPFIRVENIRVDGRIDFSDVLHIDEETNRFLSRSQLQTGDLLISIAGSIGRTAIVQVGDVPANTNQAVAIVRLKTQKTSVSYLRHFLASDAGQRWMLGDSVQLAQANLSLGQIRLTKIHFPPVSEQHRIAKILDTLDEVIQKTEQLIAKLKQIKQGLLHDLLTRGIDENGQLRDPIAHPDRFKDSVLGRVPSEWNVRPLVELAEIRSGIAKNSKKAVQSPIDVHYLRVANVQDGYLDLSEMSKITISKDELDRYAVLPGDVLMNEGGDLDKLGRGALWNGEYSPCIHQNHVFVIRCKSGLMPRYLDMWTGSQPARRYFMTAGKQTTNLASINKTALGQLPVAVPSDEEQERIVSMLSAMESRINGETKMHRKYIEQKNGLMHDLLTGKVRVTTAQGVAHV